MGPQVIYIVEEDDWEVSPHAAFSSEENARAFIKKQKRYRYGTSNQEWRIYAMSLDDPQGKWPYATDVARGLVGEGE